MATVNDILMRVRRKIDDMQKIKVSDPELIQTLNDSIDFVSNELIAALDPEMIKTFTLTAQNTVVKPNEYVKFAGQYPVKFTSDINGVTQFKHLDPEFYNVIEVRYFASRPKIAALSDTIPFEKDTHIQLLVDRTASAFITTK